MSERPYDVLFLCTGNSARSILAEVLLDHLGGGRFNAHSAGSSPKGTVNPLTVEVLQEMRLWRDGLRSKSWDEFAAPGAAPMDFVFTVCDRAAGETCPVWPGQPMTAHWGIPDPAAAEGTHVQRLQAFRAAARMLRRRLQIFVSLPLASLDRMAVRREVEAIGRITEDAAPGEGAPVTIYHNPACGTSRNVLGLIRNSGVEPRIVEYLKTPPGREELTGLIAAMGIAPRELLRRKGTPYDELGLDDPSLGDEALIDAMLAHPILINRPIVVTALGTRLCRPSETVLDILPGSQKGAFSKEDGEPVVDEDGRRLAGRRP